MGRNPIQDRFDRLSVWSRGDQRVPHKPLLVLYALGRWSRGDQGDIPFKEADADLTTLLKEFGPPRQSYHPEYPFWRLQNDGVWTVHATGPLAARQSNTDPKKSELIAQQASAGFSDDVKATSSADPLLLTEIATWMLERHFPESIHSDILAAVGLELGMAATKQKRDPKFRQRILTAYEYRCAICRFDVRLGSVSLALDAAHIRWHQAGGPDKESNGLALCVLHHKTFDLGAFTLSEGGVLLVSDQMNGTAGFDEALLRHHGKTIRPPQRSDWRPEAAFLSWHGREVFKGEARDQPGRAS